MILGGRRTYSHALVAKLAGPLIAVDDRMVYRDSAYQDRNHNRSCTKRQPYADPSIGWSVLRVEQITDDAFTYFSPGNLLPHGALKWIVIPHDSAQRVLCGVSTLCSSMLPQ